MTRKASLVIMLILLLTSVLGIASNVVLAQQSTKVLNPIADLSIFKDDPELAVGNEIWLRVSYYQGGKEERRSYLKFDLKDIPPNSEIVSAKLLLYLDMGGRPSKVGVHYSSDNSWEENKVCWNNAPSFEKTASYVNETIWFDKTWYYWMVTQDVQKALDNRLLTLVLIPNATAEDYFSDFFYSKDCVHPDLIPRLEVSYNVPPASPSPSLSTVPSAIPLDYIGYAVVGVIIILGIITVTALFVVRKRKHINDS